MSNLALNVDAVKAAARSIETDLKGYFGQSTDPDTLVDIAQSVLRAADKLNEKVIEVGDWIEPHSRELDPRECAIVLEDTVYLWLFGDQPAGPFPKDNYIITRKRSS